MTAPELRRNYFHDVLSVAARRLERARRLMESDAEAQEGYEAAWLEWRKAKLDVDLSDLDGTPPGGT